MKIIEKINIRHLKIYIIIFFAVSGIFVLIDNYSNIRSMSVEKYFSSKKTVESTVIIANKLLNTLTYDEKNKINYNNIDFSKTKIKMRIIKKLIDNKKCIVLYLKNGDQDSIIVFQENLFWYKPLGVVGTFSKVNDIQYLTLKKEHSTLIIVRETIDQSKTAYRKGCYIRVYYYDNYNSSFSLVLSLTEKYQSDINELWTNPLDLSARWKRNVIKSDIKWHNEFYPQLEVLEHNSDFISQNENIKNMPNDSNYNIVNCQDIYTKYLWSSKYKHFIICEGIFKKTGEPIAILEDFGNNKKQYMVKSKNGAITILPYGDVGLGSIKPPIKIVK